MGRTLQHKRKATILFEENVSKIYEQIKIYNNSINIVISYGDDSPEDHIKEIEASIFGILKQRYTNFDWLVYELNRPFRATEEFDRIIKEYQQIKYWTNTECNLLELTNYTLDNKIDLIFDIDNDHTKEEIERIKSKIKSTGMITSFSKGQFVTDRCPLKW